MKTHYGILERDGELQTVVDSRAICGATGEIEVDENIDLVDCKKCLKILAKKEVIKILIGTSK